MGLFNLFSSLFDQHDDYLFQYDDHSNLDDHYLSVSKSEFLNQLSSNPNLHQDHLMQVINHEDIDSITPQLDGAMGNLMAKKYFITHNANVDSEVPVEHGKLDLVVNPHHYMTITKLEMNGDQLKMQEEHINQPFAIEVKNFSKDSFHNDQYIAKIPDQLANGHHISDHSYLGVPKDFFNLDAATQHKIIDLANHNGEGVILLPYYKYDVDNQINNLINQIS